MADEPLSIDKTKTLLDTLKEADKVASVLINKQDKTITQLTQQRNDAEKDRKRLEIGLFLLALLVLFNMGMNLSNRKLNNKINSCVNQNGQCFKDQSRRTDGIRALIKEDTRSAVSNELDKRGFASSSTTTTLSG